MSPETPLCPTSIGRHPPLQVSWVWKACRFLSSSCRAHAHAGPAECVPCGVQAEPRSQKPHFHQLLRYRLPFPAPLVSMGTCLDGQDSCSGSWLVEVTSVETRLLGFDIISLRDLTLDTLPPNSHGFTPFFLSRCQRAYNILAEVYQPSASLSTLEGCGDIF